MKINIQILDFNKEKIASAAASEYIDIITLGDFSCSKRDIFFTDSSILELVKSIQKKVFLQLPLVVKEDEMQMMKRFADKIARYFDGFITGDLGMIDYLNSTGKELVYTTNMTNKSFSHILKRDFNNVKHVRPLMYKRTFIAEKVDFPKDVVLYGNMMINCATFCYHSKDDLVENCALGCRKSRELLMNNEKLHLVGRSLMTENRFDIIDKMAEIGDLSIGTIMDYDLKNEELKESIFRIKEEASKI